MRMRIAHHSSLPLVVTAAFLWGVASLGCTGKTTPPSATIVAVEGAGTTYQSRDWNGKAVTVRVPSQSTADIRGKDAEGTVRATVTAIDPAMRRVQVRTSEGQTVVLEMAQSDLADLKVGAPLVFTAPTAPR